MLGFTEPIFRETAGRKEMERGHLDHRTVIGDAHRKAKGWKKYGVFGPWKYGKKETKGTLGKEMKQNDDERKYRRRRKHIIEEIKNSEINSE